MEVVGSRESWDIREKRPTEEKAFLPHVRTPGMREREGEKEREREKKGRNGKTSWKAVAVKVRSWLEVGSWAEERRENERMRELRVFRQLGKPSRDRSREDFFSGKHVLLSSPFAPLFSFLRTRFLSLPLTPAPRSPNSVCSTTLRDQIFREQIKLRNIE